MATRTKKLQTLQNDLYKTIKPFTITTKKGRVRPIIGTLNTRYIQEKFKNDLREMKQEVLQFFEVKEQKWNNMRFSNVKRLNTR